MAVSSKWPMERREVTSPATSWTSSEMKSQSDEDRTMEGGGIIHRGVRGGGRERSSPCQKQTSTSGDGFDTKDSALLQLRVSLLEN